MTVTTGLVTSQENALFAQDLPLMLTRNALRFKNLSAEWSLQRTWVTGANGGPDNITDDEHRPARLHDGRGTLVSRPLGGSVLPRVHLLFDLDENETIDAAVVMGHNFKSLNGTITVYMGIADDPAYTTNVRQVLLWEGKSADRLVQLDLSDSVAGPDMGVGGEGAFRRFTNVRYAYLTIETTASSFGVAPEIGEVYFGRRRQMTQRPHPLDEMQTDGLIESIELQGGETSRTTRFKCRRRLPLHFRLATNDVEGDGEALVNSIAKDTDGFSDTLLYIRNPYSVPRDAPLVFSEPIKNLQFLDHARFDWRPDLTEQPPFVSKEK